MNMTKVMVSALLMTQDSETRSLDLKITRSRLLRYGSLMHGHIHGLAGHTRSMQVPEYARCSTSQACSVYSTPYLVIMLISLHTISSTWSDCLRTMNDTTDKHPLHGLRDGCSSTTYYVDSVTDPRPHIRYPLCACRGNTTTQLPSSLHEMVSSNL